jgi:CRP-like cAMP-binding protein
MTENFNQIYSDLEDLGTADGFIDEILEIIQHISLFSAFSEDEIRAVCHYMRCFAAPRNYALMEEGIDDEHLLIVLTGTAEMKHISAEGCEVITELAAGSIIGEVSMIDGKTQLAGCITTRPVDFAVLTQAGLNRLLVQAPRLGNKILLALLQLLSSRLRENDKRFSPSLA